MKTKSTTPKGLHNTAQGCEPRATLGKPTPGVPNPVRVASPLIPDIEWETIERTINACIHELVYALHHIEENETEEAQDCLTTVGMNVDTVQQQILACVLKKGASA